MFWVLCEIEMIGQITKHEKKHDEELLLVLQQDEATRTKPLLVGVLLRCTSSGN